MRSMEAVLRRKICYTVPMETNTFSFEALYGQYAQEIKRFIFTICRRDAALTEDLFQTTWMSVWRNLASLRDAGAARAWLYAVAKNETRRYYFKNKAAVLSFETDEAPAEMELPDEAASRFPEAFADAELVKGLLARLAETEQQIVLLHYAYDMRLTEIAELYGANYNTIKSILRRSIAKMKKLADGARMNEYE